MENQKILIGLSGGINSMAVLCWLIEAKQQPKELHLFYAHFKEHSHDTFTFVKEGIRLARKHFSNVKVKITRNSIIEYFEREKLIPHPARSPCTIKLKIEPIEKYCFENQIDIDLIGYVKEELKRRANRQKKHLQNKMFEAQKAYPIGDFTDKWCFEIVYKYIGWHPAIYDIKNENGDRLFKHNNCLPCKNMYPEDIENVKTHYFYHYQKAIELSSKLSSFWGRNEDEFYMKFGRDLGQDSSCEYCKY